MSDGLMCLHCRRYLVAGRIQDSCLCLEPQPSWDGREPAAEDDRVRDKMAERERKIRFIGGETNE